MGHSGAGWLRHSPRRNHIQGKLVGFAAGKSPWDDFSASLRRHNQYQRRWFPSKSPAYIGSISLRDSEYFVWSRIRKSYTDCNPAASHSPGEKKIFFEKFDECRWRSGLCCVELCRGDWIADGDPDCGFEPECETATDLVQLLCVVGGVVCVLHIVDVRRPTKYSDTELSALFYAGCTYLCGSSTVSSDSPFSPSSIFDQIDSKSLLCVRTSCTTLALLIQVGNIYIYNIELLVDIPCFSSRSYKTFRAVS